MAKKVKELMIECKNRNLHCSISYQKVTDFSVEIYQGYKTNYREVFYTDGHLSLKKAIKKALKYLENN